jgi:hypothetical protein
VRLLWIVLATCAALAACTPSRPSTPAPSSPTARTGSSTAPPGPPAPQPSDVAAVFIAALSGATHSGSGNVRTYIRNVTVCSQALGQRPCPPVPIAQDVQDQVVAAIGSGVVFTSSLPSRLRPDRVVAVTLGAPTIEGGRAIVSVETECGSLCGLGETLVLKRTADGWERTGTTGTSWIS